MVILVMVRCRHLTGSSIRGFNEQTMILSLSSIIYHHIFIKRFYTFLCGIPDMVIVTRSKILKIGILVSKSLFQPTQMACHRIAAISHRCNKFGSPRNLIIVHLIQQLLNKYLSINCVKGNGMEDNYTIYIYNSDDVW